MMLRAFEARQGNARDRVEQEKYDHARKGKPWDHQINERVQHCARYAGLDRVRKQLWWMPSWSGGTLPNPWHESMPHAAWKWNTRLAKHKIAIYDVETPEGRAFLGDRIWASNRFLPLINTRILWKNHHVH